MDTDDTLVLDRALSWLDGALPYVDPGKGEHRPGFDAGFPEGRLLELLLLARDLTDFLPGHYDDWADRVRSLAITAWHTEGRERRMLSRGELLPFYALYLALIDSDADPRARTRIAELVGLGFGVADGAHSRAASFEAAHHFDALGVAHRLSSGSQDFPVPVQRRDPVNEGKQVAYELTHALLYASRFGRILPSIPEPTATHDLVLIHLARWSREHDWDLTAELVHCLDLMGSPPSALSDWAWNSVVQAQRPEGVVPGPYVAADASREDHLAGSLHTTLVTAISAIHRSTSHAPRTGGGSFPNLSDRRQVMEYATAVDRVGVGAPDRDTCFAMAMAAFAENPATGLMMSRVGKEQFAELFDPHGFVRRHLALRRHADGAFGPFSGQLAAAGFSTKDSTRLRRELTDLANALSKDDESGSRWTAGSGYRREAVRR